MLRRRRRERQNAGELDLAENRGHSAVDRETLLILDEEIRRLPEKQQAAIVLCMVQGKTHDVAAAELACPLGTVKSRVAGGRATLIRRLSRRGLAPSIAMGTALGSEHLLASAIPPDLVRQTLEAALHFAINRSVRGAAVTASVMNLVEGVLTRDATGSHEIDRDGIGGRRHPGRRFNRACPGSNRARTRRSTVCARNVGS